MYTKIKIEAKLVTETGLHIGGSSAFSPIGAVDSSVVKDAVSGKPVIPGSSLKGKMRTLLAWEYAKNTPSGPENDPERVRRLFGTSKKDEEGKIKQSRLIFRDSELSNEKELISEGAKSVTEIKFENSIKRLTGEANPRQIERVVRNAEFPVEIIYSVSGDVQDNEIIEDFETIGKGIKLLEEDYLGGSGSRGYGKVSFRFGNNPVKLLNGEISSETLEKLKNKMQNPDIGE